MTGLAPIHIIGFSISLLLFYQSIRLVQSQKESILEFVLWTTFGIAVFSLSLGQFITQISVVSWIDGWLTVLGFENGPNGIFTIAILGLLLTLFYTYTISKTNEEKISELNRELALLRYEQSQKMQTTTDSSNHTISNAEENDE